MKSVAALSAFYDDPERVLRRFVVHRTGELGRVAAWLSRLLAFPRRAGDAGRLDQGRRAEMLAATARALAWANALRRWMIAINRAQKAEYLRPGFAPAPAGSPGVASRDRPGWHAPERDRAPRPPAAGFQPMEPAAIWEALKQPFLPEAVMKRMVNSVQARTVTLTREVNEHLRRMRAAHERQRTPDEDAAILGVEELPFAESVARICDDLIAAATALGEAEIVAAVRTVAADLERRCVEMAAMTAARAAAVAAVVAAEVGRQGLAAPMPAALRLAGFPMEVPPRRAAASRGSLRAALIGSTAVRPPAFASV